MTDTPTVTDPTTAPAEPTEPTEAEVQAFVERFVSDLAATAHAATVVLGDRLGLYRALAEAGPSTPADLARATGCDQRYLREWLCAQAASGYAHHDAATGRFHLDAAQAACLAHEGTPAFVAGGMAVVSSMHRDEDAVSRAFTTGEGLGWHQHHEDLFSGTERFFRPGYAANLVDAWIPALPGVSEALQEGALVADVGCGHGASTILMAEAFPRSRFVGFDVHQESIEVARQRAAEAGVEDRVTFEVAAADAFPTDVDGRRYDLVCVFDALHDMGDPTAAAGHIREALADDGALLLVEPNAGDDVDDNLHLVGRIFYSASTFICTPASRSQPGSACLGAQAGEARLRQVLADAGFGSVRRATETPFNMVLDVRP
jgi:SAM-dependent methyltransferase